MGFFEQFPYANFQQFNLDWILQVLKRMEGALDDSFQSYITEWVAENYNKLFFDAAYDPASDTLTMALAESLAGKAGGEPVSYINLAGQVLEILDKAARDRLEAVEAKLPNVESSAFTAGIFTNVVAIGDSFMTYYGGTSLVWVDKFEELAHCSKLQKFGQNGLGFSATGGTYAGLADYITRKVSVEATEPEQVTAVIIALGTNDTQNGETFENIYNGLNTGVSKAAQVFPNAVVYVVVTSSTFAASLALQAAVSKFSTVSGGVARVVDVTDVFLAAPYEHQNASEHIPGVVMQTDATHPTDLGSAIMGQAVFARICGGTYVPRYSYKLNSYNRIFTIENRDGEVYVQIGTTSNPVTVDSAGLILPAANIASFRFLRFLYGHIGTVFTASGGQVAATVDGSGPLVMRSDGRLTFNPVGGNADGKVIAVSPIRINLTSTRVKYNLSPFITP